jgi:hypothetical protein
MLGRESGLNLSTERFVDLAARAAELATERFSE